MIEFTKAFKASDGKVYPSLVEAQAAELSKLFQRAADDNGTDAPWAIEEIAEQIVKDSVRILDILTTTESSRPKARKANGATKKRKPATVQTSETSPA